MLIQHPFQTEAGIRSVWERSHLYRCFGVTRPVDGRKEERPVPSGLLEMEHMIVMWVEVYHKVFGGLMSRKHLGCVDDTVVWCPYTTPVVRKP